MGIGLRRLPGLAAGGHARILLLGPVALAVGDWPVPAVVRVIVGSLILRPDRLQDEFTSQHLVRIFQ